MLTFEEEMEIIAYLISTGGGGYGNSLGWTRLCSKRNVDNNAEASASKILILVHHDLRLELPSCL